MGGGVIYKQAGCDLDNKQEYSIMGIRQVGWVNFHTGIVCHTSQIHPIPS
jgi:hypothetical protein